MLFRSRLFSRERSGFGRSSGSVALFFVYVLITVTRFCSRLMNMFISRQREFRADAVAVRLTRDPVSLASALQKILTHWRGGQLSGEQMEAIFIINPQYQLLDEVNSTFSHLFSTHPPVKDRLDILLDLAKINFESLNQDIEKTSIRKRQEVPSVMPAPLSEWMVYQDGKWLGPYKFDHLKQLSFLSPETWVRRNQGDIENAYQDVDIRNYFQGKAASGKGVLCPRCQVSLSDVKYEGTEILQCSLCRGILADEGNIMRIIIREEVGFSEQVIRCGHVIQKMLEGNIPLHIDLKTVNFMECPYCADPKPKMFRQFYNLAYPIEVDRCIQCSRVWFDRDELEILQFLVEEYTAQQTK